MHDFSKTKYDHRAQELERPVCYLCLDEWRDYPGERSRALKKKSRKSESVDEESDRKLSQDLMFKMNDPAFARQLHMGGVTYIRKNGAAVTINTVFTSDAALHALEFEYYCRPVENMRQFKIWQDEKTLAETECREIKGKAPELLPTYLWLADVDSLSDDLIIKHATGSWDSLADWKCDLEIALTHLPIIEFKLVQQYRKGFTEEEVGQQFGYSEHFVRESLKSANRCLRKWIKLTA